MRVQHSYELIKNLRVSRASDSRSVCSRRRAVPGTGIAVVEDRLTRM